MGDYGIKISKAGVDVKTAADDELLISSKFPMFKIHTQGTTNLKMYKTTISDGGDGITAAQTTIGVASTTGFRASGHIWIFSDLGAWEAVSYTGISGNSFTGCTRGYLSTTAWTAAEGQTVVAGYNEFSVSHTFSYPPVHFVYRNSSGVKKTVGVMLDESNYIDAYVTTSDLIINVNYADFNGTPIIPSGTYDQYDFIYIIMADSILTPYY